MVDKVGVKPYLGIEIDYDRLEEMPTTSRSLLQYY